MSSIRPRHLAVGFTLYFGLIAYLAYGVARRSTGPWFTPAISTMVYQTTMVGGIIVLTGLLGVASFLPYLSRTSGAGLPDEAPGGTGRLMSTAFPESESSGRAASLDPWTPEDILGDEDLDTADYVSPRRAQDAAVVSAALTRMEDGTPMSASTALMDRLAGIRAREGAVAASGERDATRTLVHLVEEMRPLLVVAREAGLDVAEVQRLYSAATIGREGDIAYRVRLVEQMKRTLESALSERVSNELHSLLRDLEQAKAMTDQAHGAELTAAEAVALLDTGHHVEAYNRARTARRILDEQVGPRLRPVPLAPAPASFLAFVGPSFAAAVYVAIAAMLLPGAVGFLEANFALNTGVILFLSYGWFGLVLYAIVSIFVATRPPSPPPVPWESLQDDF